ncbi:MAG: aspartyl-phosphate phosphatase Spo0E family protein [Bacillota bacterium]
MAVSLDVRRLRDDIEILRTNLLRVIEANGGDLSSAEVLSFSRRLDEAILCFYRACRAADGSTGLAKTESGDLGRGLAAGG